jgi:hypothetical protein
VSFCWGFAKERGEFEVVGGEDVDVLCGGQSGLEVLRLAGVRGWFPDYEGAGYV